MFPRITPRNVSLITMVIWGFTLIIWKYSVTEVERFNELHAFKRISVRATPSPTTSSPAAKYQRTIIWRERNPYTKLIFEAVNHIIGPDEDWKVHSGCSDEIIHYTSIPLAVNTLTLMTALLRYFAIEILHTKDHIMTWYGQPNMQKALHDVVQVLEHTINVYEL